MAQETTIYSKAGEDYIVQAPSGQKLSHNYNSGRTRIRVHTSGTYVDPNPTIPTITITSSIATGSTISGIVAWTATVVAGEPTSIDFLVDGAVIYSDSTYVYGYNLDTKTLSNGSHTLQVVAKDAFGSRTPVGGSVTVNNTVTAPAGTIVPTGTNLENAMNAASNGSTLLLRGGTHLVDFATTSKLLTIQNYPNEIPTITSGTSVRQDYLYFTGSGRSAPITIRGITFKAGSGIFHDSMGSALSETDGADWVLYEDCTFIGDPNLDDHQQLLYQRLGKRITVRRCIFEGNGTKGFGFHQYPGSSTDPQTVVEDSIFRNIGYALTTDSKITVQRCRFENVPNVCIQLRNSATGSIIRDNVGVNVGTGIQNPSLAGVNTNNVWN